MVARLRDALSQEPPARVVHSGLARTRRLAEAIARATGCAITADARWQERDFGSWEGRTWTRIWRDTGRDMDRMVTQPDRFRPGGGETTRELWDRALAALDEVDPRGSTLVVSHGGPIACVRAAAAGASIQQVIGFVPRCGELVELP